MPQLALLIPVFNDLDGLFASLDSLLAARRPTNTATIVVDDGSIEPVVVPIRYDALHVVVLRLDRNQGIENALNFGLAEAFRQGFDYIARLDAGDTIAPDRLERQVRVLEESPDIGFVGSSARFIDDAGHDLFVFRAPETDQAIRHRMHINSCVPHPTVMMRSSALKLAGSYSTDFPAAEDYELFFRLLGSCRTACLPDVLVTIVASSKGISVRRRRQQLFSRLRIQRRFFNRLKVVSYVGIATTLLLLAVPNMLVVGLKRLIGHSRF